MSPNPARWLAVLALAPSLCLGTTAPFAQLIGSSGTSPLISGTCDADGPSPAIHVDADLKPGDTFRYSPAVVTPYYFDDEGDFNLIWNQDATLFVSPVVQWEGTHAFATLPVSSLASWYDAIDRVPAHTELALRVVTYDPTGKAVAASRISWDCTTGAILSSEHRGNAAGPSPFSVRVVEYYHAALDHYFMTADASEIAALDNGTITGWQRTGAQMTAYREVNDVASSVCRFYIPPQLGDSHFYSASPDECALVRTRFPSFVQESASVFAVALPDAAGACPGGLRPIYRLWNARADSNHRYTSDAAQKAAMIARGYVAEGDGDSAVAFCALP